MEDILIFLAFSIGFILIFLFAAWLDPPDSSDENYFDDYYNYGK